MIARMAAPVLIVDDDPGFRRLAERMIRAIGLTVVGQAEDVEAAVVAANELRPVAALVDVGLPDGDGIELAHQLASLPWRPRVVLISSDPDAASLARGRADAQALPFVAKEDLPTAPLRRLLTAE